MQEQFLPPRLLLHLVLDRWNRRLFDDVRKLRVRGVVELRVERETVAVRLHQQLHFLDGDAQRVGQLLRRGDVVVLDDGRGDGFFQPIHQVGSLRWQPERAALLRKSVQDRLPDPPHGVGDELDVLVGIELLGRVDQADVPLIDEIEEEDVGVAIALRIRDHEAEVGLDQLLQRRLVVLILLDAPPQLPFPLRRQPRDPGNLLQVLIEQVVGVVAILLARHGLSRG